MTLRLSCSVLFYVYFLLVLGTCIEMSDARAKAEARRQKILARTNKQVSAVAGDEDVGTEPSNDETSPAPKVNPLRRRREHIEAVAAKIEEEKAIKEEEAASAPATPIKETNDDPDVETIDEMTKIKSTSSSIDTPSPMPKKEIVYVKKTMKEIEEEVAINTKKFDENALKKEDKKEDNKPAVAVKPKVKLQSNVQPSSVMRLIRLLLIVLLGTSIGYQAMKTHKDTEMKIAAVTRNLEAMATFDEFAPDAAFADTNDMIYDLTNTPAPPRTWLGYFAFKLQSQIECSVTAVGLVWWVSRAFDSSVNARFKVQPQKGGNIMQTLLQMYQSGFEGIFEIAYSALGEVSLFLFTIIVSVVGFTLLYTGTFAASAASSGAVNEL